MNDTARVEDIVQVDFFLYDIDVVDRSLIRELSMRIVGKHSITVRLIRYGSHTCYVSNINVLFKACRCPSCDQFIKRAS